MTLENKDSDGSYINRLALERKISALEFFKANGWPVYRLHTQLRMAADLFDTCHREVYSDLPFKYGPASRTLRTTACYSMCYKVGLTPGALLRCESRHAQLRALYRTCSK